MDFATKLVHNRASVDPVTGAAGVPIYLASTYAQNVDQPGQLNKLNLPNQQGAFRLEQRGGSNTYDYARSGNPTRHALEEVIAELEGGEAGFAFSSGMAAISTVLLGFSSGDHLVVSADVYGGTYRLIDQVLPRFGMTASFVDTTDIASVRAAIRPETKAIYVETPSNPLLKTTDLRAISALGQGRGLLTIVDNTFLTPYYQRPLALGCDIVVHSATKFLSGHSDVVAGLVVSNDAAWTAKIAYLQNALGAVLGVQDCWLVLRGLKTLKARLDLSATHAQQLAEWLGKQEWVRRVYYPGLPNHPGHELAERQTSGFGAVLSFEVARDEHVRALLKQTKLPLVGVSLGAVESILTHPATMSHAAMPAADRVQRGISERLLRLSVGLEDPRDLKKDIIQAIRSDHDEYSRARIAREA